VTFGKEDRSKSYRDNEEPENKSFENGNNISISKSRGPPMSPKYNKDKFKIDSERLLLNSKSSKKSQKSFLDSDEKVNHKPTSRLENEINEIFNTDYLKTEVNVLNKMKSQVIDIIVQKSEALRNLAPPGMSQKFDSIYNQLTYESLICLEKLLKFGFYSQNEKGNIQAKKWSKQCPTCLSTIWNISKR
jgi:leucyl-tRNA synthetase